MKTFDSIIKILILLVLGVFTYFYVAFNRYEYVPNPQGILSTRTDKLTGIIELPSDDNPQRRFLWMEFKRN
jgi:hypothetical protein